MDEAEQAVEQVRRKRMIIRLRGYPKQKETIVTAQKTINDLRREVGGVKSQVLNDMPHSTDVSDPTYQQVLHLPVAYRQVAELEQEIEDAKAEIKLIDAAVWELNPTEQFVIRCRYLNPVNKKTYRVLAREKGYAESTLKNAHTTAIKILMRFL